MKHLAGDSWQLQRDLISGGAKCWEGARTKTMAKMSKSGEGEHWFGRLNLAVIKQSISHPATSKPVTHKSDTLKHGLKISPDTGNGIAIF